MEDPFDGDCPVDENYGNATKWEPLNPHNTAVLGVNRTTLTVNTKLMQVLGVGAHVVLTVENGCPVLCKSALGWAVTKHPRGESGVISARKALELASASLPVPSRWLMEPGPSGKVWRGRLLGQLEYQPAVDRIHQGPSYRQLPAVAERLVQRLFAAGTIQTAVTEAQALAAARTMVNEAWADVAGGRPRYGSKAGF